MLLWWKELGLRMAVLFLLSLWVVGTVTALLALGLGFLNGFFQRLVWAWCKSWESGGGKAEGGVERTVVGC